MKAGGGRRFHGDARRFPAVAELVSSRFPQARNVAGVRARRRL